MLELSWKRMRTKRFIKSSTASSDWLSRLMEDAQDGTEFSDSDRIHIFSSDDSSVPLKAHDSLSLVEALLGIPARIGARGMPFRTENRHEKQLERSPSVWLPKSPLAPVVEVYWGWAVALMARARHVVHLHLVAVGRRFGVGGRGQTEGGIDLWIGGKSEFRQFQSGVCREQHSPTSSCGGNGGKTLTIKDGDGGGQGRYGTKRNEPSAKEPIKICFHSPLDNPNPGAARFHKPARVRYPSPPFRRWLRIPLMISVLLPSTDRNFDLMALGVRPMNVRMRLVAAVSRGLSGGPLSRPIAPLANDSRPRLSPAMVASCGWVSVVAPTV
uniref:Uncharacterized protein n=1 Tax=Anopheles farauti TaxID=69004 RepID=A0A182QX84_9DIPT